MSLPHVGPLVLAWLAGFSVGAFGLFAWDKWRAGRPGARRIAESTLLWASMLGGWPGGLLGILLLRHKSAKTSFLLKFAAVFIPWAALVALVIRAWKL